MWCGDKGKFPATFSAIAPLPPMRSVISFSGTRKQSQPNPTTFFSENSQDGFRKESSGEYALGRSFHGFVQPMARMGFSTRKMTRY
jgi:hypothetical protein